QPETFVTIYDQQIPHLDTLYSATTPNTAEVSPVQDAHDQPNNTVFVEFEARKCRSNQGFSLSLPLLRRICKVDHGLSSARTPNDSPTQTAVTVHRLYPLVKQEFTQAARPMLQLKVTATGTAFIETDSAR
ncbi:hypothetical protein LTS16_008778, partial [Friedmanniomyces endolithicus]